MQQIQKLYRKDIVGEDVNITGTYSDQGWRYQTEFLPFPELPNLNPDRGILFKN